MCNHYFDISSSTYLYYVCRYNYFATQIPLKILIHYCSSWQRKFLHPFIRVFHKNVFIFIAIIRVDAHAQILAWYCVLMISHSTKRGLRFICFQIGCSSDDMLSSFFLLLFFCHFLLAHSQQYTLFLSWTFQLSIHDNFEWGEQEKAGHWTLLVCRESRKRCENVTMAFLLLIVDRGRDTFFYEWVKRSVILKRL